jgi:DNA-directed RNA polymerase specialized sigma24 family protein
MASTAVLDTPSSRTDVFENGQGPSPFAFTRLLEWLDDGVESCGETYLEMHRRLTAYFDRRNRPFADDLADETLGRISRTLELEGTIATTPPARYCYVVARFVLLEDIRRRSRLRREDSMQSAIDSPAAWSGAVAADNEAREHEARLERLDRCLQALDPESRALVEEYYRDSGRDRIERRRDMARRLGISMNALGIRVWRIRAALEAQMAAPA